MGSRPSGMTIAKRLAMVMRKKTSSLKSGEVEAVEVHDLVPRGHEVLHELVL